MIITIIIPFNSNIGGSFYYYKSFIAILEKNTNIKTIKVVLFEKDEAKHFNSELIEVHVIEKIKDNFIKKLFLRLIDKIDKPIFKSKFPKLFFKLKNTIANYNNNLNSFVNLNQTDFYVITAPFYNKKIFKNKVIAIIHDLYFLPHIAIELENIKRDFEREIATEFIAKKAEYIFCESPSGKNDLINEYKIASNKIVYLPTGPAPFIYTSKPDKNGFPLEILFKNNFIFYPGHIGVDKNQSVVVKAVNRLVKELNIKIHLVLTVPSLNKQYSKFLTELIDKLDIKENVILLQNVNGGNMVWLYENSLCLCMASKIGPTNMPIWEAMILGCPVVASNIGDHGWQIKNAGVLFEPNDYMGLSNIFFRLITDENLRQTYITNGYESSKEVLENNKQLLLDNFINDIK